MKALRFFAALVLAAMAQSLGIRLFDSFLLVIDLFLIVAVFTGLEKGSVASMLIGSTAGLVQDALTGGLFGLHGFADTLVTWTAARLRQRVVIQNAFQVSLLFALAAAFQQTILVALQYLMLPGTILPGLGVMMLRMTSAGLLGLVLLRLSRRFRSELEDWRQKRNRRLALEVD